MSRYNHKVVEEEILKFWEKKKIFDKVKAKNKGKKVWSFIDGPITANNPMGVHHAWGRTYKDVYQRFKAMQGYDQRYQNGFDCQGLWLEVETEKELNFNSREDIEKFGLEKFSKACRKRVEKFSGVQTQQSIRLGQWMDWKNSYFTMSDNNVEAIWNFLKKCHEKKWLYKGTKVLPWCTRCGTSSSQHEMSDGGYAELTHPSVYVKAKIRRKENEYLLIWTTTEWTLSSNVAAAVNPDLDYAMVKKNKEVYYLSEATLGKLGGDYVVLDTMKGKDLLGLEYESFYPEIEVQKIKHKVVPWNDVGESEGTGIVHIAPTCGAEDHELGKKLKLPLITPALNEEGIYNKGFGWLTGEKVSKKLKKEIVEDLDKRGILYKVEDYTHRYPICWRCKEELVFRVSSEWFIKSDEIMPLMKKEAKKVKWEPEHVGKLMQDWLENMGDWNIGRKRYWGLPLMFFECGCGHFEVIGSKKELKQKSVNKKLVDSLPELHRPWIDKIKIKCSKCKKEVSRIKEVGDCWLDAGIVPFSTLKYFSDKTYWKKWFPAELVIEMRAQVRLWFYSLLFMSVTLEGKAPYKKVLAHEEVRDGKGEPMHKSKGNAIWFNEAVEKMGADVMRWIYCEQNIGFNLKFGYHVAQETNRNFDIVWNLGNYVKMNLGSGKESDDVASKWIISRRESTKKLVTEFLDNLEPNKALNAVREFLIEDLSRKYVKFIRDSLDDKKVKATLSKCYLEGLKLLAPFTPFVTEKIYQDIFNKKESLFLESWSKYDSKLINKKLESNVEIVQNVIQKILFSRENSQIGVRWPLQEAFVYTKKKEIVSAVKQLSTIIKSQTNVKKVTIKDGNEEIKINAVLTPKLEKEGFTREVIRRLQSLRKKAGLNKDDKIKLELDSKTDLNYDLILKIVNAKLDKISKSKIEESFKIRDKEFLVKFDTI